MNIYYHNIVLRAIEKADLELIREMINDPAISNMTGGSSFPVSIQQQDKWFESIDNKKNELRLMIDTKEYGPIGLIMFTNIDYINSNAELHFKIASSKNVRGKGYGTKATHALLEYGFNQMNLHCIYSSIIEYNIASKRVHEKCGFYQEGILKSRIYKNGKYYNLTEWSITKEQWIKKHKED